MTAYTLYLAMRETLETTQDLSIDTIAAVTSYDKALLQSASPIVWAGAFRLLEIS